MYTTVEEVVEPPPPPPGALKNHHSGADGSFSPNLLPTGAARSEDAGFRNSLLGSVQETGGDREKPRERSDRGRFLPRKLGDGGYDAVDAEIFGRGDAGDGDGGGGGGGDDGGTSTGMFGRGARRQDNGRVTTVFLVLNFMIGSGILNTPQTFRDSGLAATTVLYFIACPAVWFGVVVLIQAAEALSSGGGKEGGGGETTLDDLEYTELTRRTLGKYGPPVVDGSIVLQNGGGVCAYVLLIGGLVTSLIAECTAGDTTGVWWQSFYFVTPVITVLFVMPPCLVRHFSNLRCLAPLSLFAIVAVVCLVLAGSPFYAEAERVPATEAETLEIGTGLNAPLLGWDWTGSLTKIGSVMFAVSFSPAALHSYSGMGTRTAKEWRVVAGISVFTGAVLCYCTGLAGYLAFRSATEGDILDNFSGPLAACFKILVVVHLILCIPSHVVILRHSLFALVGSDVMVAGFVTVSLVTIGVMVAIVGGVMALVWAGMTQGDLFGYILDLTGGITASLTGFILPALAYLQATKGYALLNDVDEKNIARYRAGCKALASFGCVVAVMVPTAVVLKIVRS